MTDYAYAPGEWTALAHGGRAALLAPEVDDAAVTAIWESLSAGGSLETWLEVLAGNGLASLPGFGLVEPGSDGVRVVVRGDVVALVEDYDVAAGGMRTWREHVVAGAAGVTLQVQAAERLLPLVGGVVLASSLQVGEGAPGAAGAAGADGAAASADGETGADDAEPAPAGATIADQHDDGEHDDGAGPDGPGPDGEGPDGPGQGAAAEVAVEHAAGGWQPDSGAGEEGHVPAEQVPDEQVPDEQVPDEPVPDEQVSDEQDHHDPAVTGEPEVGSDQEQGETAHEQATDEVVVQEEQLAPWEIGAPLTGDEPAVEQPVEPAVDQPVEGDLGQQAATDELDQQVQPDEHAPSQHAPSQHAPDPLAANGLIDSLPWNVPGGHPAAPAGPAGPTGPTEPGGSFPYADEGDHDGRTERPGGNPGPPMAPQPSGSAQPSGPVDPVEPLASQLGLPDAGDHDGHTVLVSQLQQQRADAAAAEAPEAATLASYSEDAVPGAGVPAAPVLHLALSTGQQIGMATPVLIGRAPEAPRFAGGEAPQLVTVPSPQQDISRTHVEVRADGDHVLVTDLRSTNGTVVVLPGAPPRRLHPGESVPVAPGTVIDLGDGVTAVVTEPTAPATGGF